MKLREGDVFHGTVGLLANCGIVFVFRTMDQLLTPMIGPDLMLVLATPVIVWGGLTSICVTYRAFKGGYGGLDSALQIPKASACPLT